MNTGYYIRDDLIYGPSGDTKSFIDDGEVIVGVRSSGYWVEDDGHIFDSSGTYTQFYIAEDDIYGPGRYLPWL